MINYITFKLILLGVALLLAGLLLYETNTVPKLICSCMEGLGILILSAIVQSYFGLITWLPMNLW